MSDRAHDDDLARFLVRAVLDPEFCALARRAPDEAFAGYDLSEEERQTLRAGDEGILRLLGLALRGEAEPSRAPQPAGPEPDTPVPVALQPISLVLTVQPYALSTPEGIQMSFTASVAAAPQAGAPPDPAASAPEPADFSPWEHDLDSERTRGAAAAVREATPEQRRARILDLLAAMTTRERRGGDGAGTEG